MLVDADARGLSFTLRVDGKPDSPWSQCVASQQKASAAAGQPWGSRLILADAVLVYATHRSITAMHADAEAAVSYLDDAALPQANEARRTEWRGALDLANAQTAGELLYAVWPGLQGGIGVGGAYRSPAS